METNNINKKDLSEEEKKKKLEQLHNLLVNTKYTIKYNVHEKGEDLALAIYNSQGKFIFGIRQSTYQDPEVRSLIESALQEREKKIKREQLEDTWQVQALLGHYEYILINKLLPYNVFRALYEAGEIYYLTEEIAEEMNENPLLPPTRPGWYLTENGEKQLRNMAIQTISEDQVQVLIELIKEEQKNHEHFRKQAWLVHKAKEILKELYQLFKDAPKIPETDYLPEGPEIQDPSDPENIYGGGRWWVIEKQKGRILMVLNNGGDGDDWSLNNIRTGGAGAIGVFIPYSEDVEKLLNKLKEINEQLDETVRNDRLAFSLYLSYNPIYTPMIETPLG